MKLSAACCSSPGLRLALALEIERHCSADEILQAASSSLSVSPAKRISEKKLEFHHFLPKCPNVEPDIPP